MLADVIRVLRAVDPQRLGRGELEDLIAGLGSVEAVAAERRLAAMRAIDGLNDGGASSATVVRSQAKVSQKKATQAARTAEKLAAMPRTRKRLARGEITEEHANAAAVAADRAGDAEKADRELQPTLTAPADLFETRSREWADINEARDERERRYTRQRRNRKVVFGTDTADGSFTMFATTDTVEGSDLRKAIQAETDRLHRDDGGRDGARGSGRTDEQRRLDALVALIKRGAGLESTSKSRRPHPRYRGVVRIPLERYLGDPGVDATTIGEGPLPRSVVDRVLCDAELSPLIVDGDSNPLWIGRTTRTATDEQWMALIDRDGGCVVCGTDPSYCEAHHVHHWQQGGNTDIDNLALLCTRHHHDLHDANLDLTQTDHGWELRPRHKPSAARAA